MIDKFFDYILPSLQETAIMIIPSIIISTILGLILALLVYIINHVNGYKNKYIYMFFNWIINALRSIPFLILIIVLFPLSYFLIKTTIGPYAAIIPLSLAATPFSARLFESSFESIDKNIIIGAQSYGASIWQIIFKVILPESKIAIIRSITTVFINLLGFSSIAGTIGAGGIGDLIIRYGYQRYDSQILWTSLIIIILTVQIIQSISNYIVKYYTKKYNV